MSTITYSKTFSITSIVAVVAAALSFTSGAFLGMIFAGAAIIAGIIGIVLAISPNRRGGVISVFSIVGGAIGILAAIIKALLWIF